MTTATYSSTKPLQAKRIWHSDVIDRLLLVWPVLAVATGAILLWLFGFAPGAAITFGLLAGCVVAVAWTFATVPYARLSDGLKTYEIDSTGTPTPRDRRVQKTIMMSHETVFWAVSLNR